MNLNDAVAVRVDSLHRLLDLIYPSALKNGTGGTVRSKDIVRRSFQSRCSATCKALHGILAIFAFRIVVKDFGCAGVNQAHISGICEAFCQPTLGNEWKFLLDVHAGEGHAG